MAICVGFGVLLCATGLSPAEARGNQSECAKIMKDNSKFKIEFDKNVNSRAEIIERRGQLYDAAIQKDVTLLGRMQAVQELEALRKEDQELEVSWEGFKRLNPAPSALEVLKCVAR